MKEFFLAEFNFDKTIPTGHASWESESLTLPGARFLWKSSSSLIAIQRQAVWTVFLWGAAFHKTENKTARELAQQISLDLVHGVSLHSSLVSLEGSYGIVAWNETESRLLIATDPIGMTKVYYGKTNGKVVVSSHAQLVARKQDCFDISGKGLSILFSIKGIIQPYSIFKNVSTLEPAEILELTTRGEESRRYWSVLDNVVPFQGSLVKAEEKLQILLETTLQKYPSVNNGLVGVSMSSGVDSALLAALLVRGGIPAQGLTVGYNPRTKYDETQGAVENAKRIGLPIQEVQVSDKDVKNIIDYVTQNLPEPLGDATVLPQLVMTLASRDKIAYIIDGTGADNIFGGMQKFIAERYARQYLRIPQLIRRGLIRPVLNMLPSSRKSEFTNVVRKMQKFSYGVELNETDQKVYWSRFMSKEAVEQLILPAFSPDGYLADSLLLGFRAEVPARYDEFFASTYTSIRGTMPTHATQKIVTLQYASGKKYYTPFLTPSMIEFAVSLPTSYKIAGKETKLVLRRAAAKLLPEGCTSQRKATFSPPIGRWLMGPLKSEFMDLLKGNDFFNADAVEKMISRQVSGWRDWQWELWLVFIFLKWIKEVIR